MRILMHSILSLVRKPAKTLMLFIILLVIFGLVFTGIIIQNSIAKSKEFVRKELGAVVEMKPDYIKAMTDKLTGEDLKQLSLSTTLAKELAKDSTVKNLYISMSSSVSNEKLKSAQKNDGSIMMATAAVSANGPAFPIVGSSELIPIEFEYGNLSLAEGRHRTAEDEGKNTLLVSEEFASKNNLSNGDSVELTSVDNKKLSFEIIGIYKGSEAFAVDIMYTSMDSVQRLDGFQGDEGNNNISINFVLDDPLEVDAFIGRYKAQMPSEYIVLYARDSEYKTLTRPLDLIATITSILLWVVFIAGAIILIAIITIFIRDRKFEIGLLLASGEAKTKIVMQFVLEIMIVAFIAFFAAAGSSQISSNFTANWITSNQLVEENTTEQSGFIAIGIGDNAKNEVNIRDVAKNFDVSVGQETMIYLVLISFGMVLASASAPLIIILGYKPRETLQN